MARLFSLAEKVRNWFLVLMGVLIGVSPAVSSAKPDPGIQDRLAAVRTRMRELQPKPAQNVQKSDKAESTLVAQWASRWANWNNWNNWGNWVSWNNWANWGNY
jgi:hypothetical protein